MSNDFIFVWIVAFLGILTFSVLKIRKERLSLFNYIALMVLPSTLVGVFGYMVSLYSYFFEVEYEKIFPSFYIIVFPAIYGLMLMLPSLMLYAVIILSLEKRFSPPAWKLFLWTGLVAGLSALPYGLIGELTFLFFPIITGMLSMMIVYYFNRRENNESK